MFTSEKAFRTKMTHGSSERWTFADLQSAVGRTYQPVNDRWFDLPDLLAQVGRFTLRSVKAVRRGEFEKQSGDRQAEDAYRGVALTNLAIALSWFVSTINRLQIDLEDATWSRFPGHCATCSGRPCSCPASGTAAALARPATISEYQEMFGLIYPPSMRDRISAAMHLAEELAEYGEACTNYRGRHTDEEFASIRVEAADFVSCVAGLFTRFETDLESTLIEMFANGCHRCGGIPCSCTFDEVMSFRVLSSSSRVGGTPVSKDIDGSSQ